MTQQNLFQQRRTIPAIRNMLISEGYNAVTVDVFLGLHKANKHVFEAFEKEALRRIGNGTTRLSSKGIIEYLRDQCQVKTSGMRGFNISNTYTAWYARVFVFLYPQHKDLFQLNEIKIKEAA